MPKANEPLPRPLESLIQNWWNCSDEAVLLVKRNATLSLCLAAANIALAWERNRTAQEAA